MTAKSLPEIGVQLWFCQPERPLQNRAVQSDSVRLLLKQALATLGFTLCDRDLRCSGLELLHFIHSEFGVQVSLSHCSSLVAVALSDDKLGVDCEAANRDRNWEAMANQFFTTQEALEVSNAAQQDQAFLKLWTLKEAYIKASGGSIFGGINKLTLDPGHGSPLQHHGDSRWQAWHGVIDGCHISICFRSAATAFPQLIEYCDPSAMNCSVVKRGLFLKKLPNCRFN